LGLVLTSGSNQYAFGAFVEPLEAQFGWSRTQINVSISLGFLTGLLSPFVGRLVDRVGTRPVMAVSLMMLAASYGLRPLMTELWHWYALSLLAHAAMPGAAVLPTGRIVGMWFPRTRGRMMGVTMMGANFGGMTMPLVAAWVISTVSWQAGYGTFAVLAGVVAVVAMVVVRDKPLQPTSLSAAREPGAVAPAGAVDVGSVREALRTRSFWAMTVAITMGSFSYHAVLSQIIPHLTNQGLTLNQAAGYLSVFALFGMVGKIVFGYSTERVPTRYVFMVSLVLQGIGLAVLTTLANTPAMWAVVWIYGMAFGGMGAIFPILAQDIFGLRWYGSIYGLVNLATIFSAVIGPIMTGLVFDNTGTYKLAFLATLGFYVVGIVALTMAKPLQPRGTA
jgi:MFS family permease